jgi:hypothetical protein
MYYYASFFVLIFEMEFPYVFQSGFEFLGSSDPPASAPGVAGVIRHVPHTWLFFFFP